MARFVIGLSLFKSNLNCIQKSTAPRLFDELLCIQKSIVLCLFNELLLHGFGIFLSLVFQLLFQILLPLLVDISLLHVAHQFLNIHLEGKSPISVEGVEEILTKIPSVPGDGGPAFVSLLCAKVQLIASLALQEEDARDSFRAVGRSFNKDLPHSSLDSAQVNELLLVAPQHEAIVCLWNHVRREQRLSKLLKLGISINCHICVDAD